MQVRLLYDGKERGRMYAAYALSSVMTPDADLQGMQSAGVVTALIAVLNTSRVTPNTHVGSMVMHFSPALLHIQL